MKNPLKIGLLIDDVCVPHWIYLVVERLSQNPHFQIQLIVQNATVAKERSLMQKIIAHRFELHRLALLKATNWVFDKFLKKRLISNDAFALKDITSLVPKVSRLQVQPIQTKHRDVFTREDIQTIRSHGCDVFLRFGFRILKGDILTICPGGIWSLHHGDNRVNRGGPAGFWEVFLGWPLTGSILQVLSENLDDGLVLYRSQSATQFRSVYKNRNLFYLKAVTFFERKLEELYQLGAKDFLYKAQSQNLEPQFYSNPLFVAPSFSFYFFHILQSTFRYLKDKTKSIVFLEQWILLFRLGDGLSTSIRQFQKLIPPKDRFWADPHVIFHANKYYIFIEEYMYDTNRGHVSVIEMDENGKCSDPIRVIEEPTHLSYPFVLKIKNDIYLIPENSESSAVPVYKATRFPYEWERVADLSEGKKWVDVTVMYHEGYWWMFANRAIIDGASNYDELFLLYREDLFKGEWTEHPQNPIVTDVRSARPAGRIFEHNGQLYRPSQDCSRRYGYATKINKITHWDTKKYSEETVSEILPKWDKRIVATHSLAYEKNLTVIDAVRVRSAFF